MVLANNSRLILLDEPSAGTAPDERPATMALINNLAEKEKLTLLFTEHDMIVFAWRKRHCVLWSRDKSMANGLRQLGSKRIPRLRQVYLGEKS